MYCFIIAEAGVNHNGSEELAMKLIENAAKAGANAVKFQTFKAESLVSKGTKTAVYQKNQTGNDDQLSMLKKLEISEDLHVKLIRHCRKFDIEFLSTPFDIDSARFLMKLGMKKIKVPSGELTNIPFIRELTALNMRMILSTGMADMKEVCEAVYTIRDEREKRGYSVPLQEMLTVLHCTSNYPACYEDINLNAMLSMRDVLDLPVGYSDHTEGTLVSVAAVAMGATLVEKHFTLDRTMPGPDHMASLEPDELERLVLQIRQIESCLGDGKKIPRDSELPVRDLVRRSVTMAVDKKVGETIQSVDLVLLRPGDGISPKQLNDVVGKTLKVSRSAGDTLQWQDFC